MASPPLRRSPPSSSLSSSSSFYKRFINAAVAPDPEAVFNVVRAASPHRRIDDAGPAGVTALMWAARADDAGLVRVLLAAGADPDRRDDGGCTALVWAARAGAESALGELLSAGAAVNSADAFGRTPLVWAATCGRSGAAERLLAAGADAARWHASRWAPLPVSARLGDLALTAALLSAGCDANQADAGGSTALACAVYNGHADVVRLLLAQRGVDVNSRDGNGDTPLLLAALAGRTELAGALLRAGADVDGRDDDGRTALSWACSCGGGGLGATSAREATAAADDLVDELLRWRASVDTRDRWGRTALMWAAEEGRAGAIERLLTAGADPYARDARGSTALHLAAGAASASATDGGDALLGLLLRAPGPHPRPVELLDGDGMMWTTLAERSRIGGCLSADCLAALEHATGAYYVRPDRVGRALVVCVKSAVDTVDKAGEETAAEADDATAADASAAAGCLRMALERLGYLVDECPNPTAAQMRDAVVQFARGDGGCGGRHGSTAAACFVTPASVASEDVGDSENEDVGDGRQSSLLGADGVALPVASVVAAFANSACAEELRGRPKVLMFHTIKRRSSRVPRRPGGFGRGGDGRGDGVAALRPRTPLPPARERHLFMTFSVEGGDREAAAAAAAADAGVVSCGGGASYASALADEVDSAFGEFEVHKFLTAVKTRLSYLGDEVAVETRSTLDKLLIFAKQDESATMTRKYDEDIVDL